MANEGTFGYDVNNIRNDPARPDGPFGKQVSEAAQARNADRKVQESEEVVDLSEAPADVQQDRAIVEKTIASEVTISSSNEPMILTYKAAVEKINEILAPELGVERPIDSALEQGIDVSPEATAERIVSLTTAMLSRYLEVNPNLETKEAVDRFVDVISGGIEQGFNEAREILDGLGVLEGDIAANIDRTFELVQEGLQKFREDNGGTVAVIEVESESDTTAPKSEVEETIDPLLSE